MLRLTEQLFAAEPKAAYADYYERALYNHILASINPTTPGYVYFTPIRPDHYRVYSQPDQSFWCCVGTGMENPGKYGEFIYAQANDGLYVNLFIASELSVTNLGLIPSTEENRSNDRKPLTPSLSPSDGERVAEGRVRGSRTLDRSAVALGLTLRQETTFPDEARTSLILKLKKPATFTLHLRHPGWVGAGEFKVRVNDKPVTVTSTPSSYAELRREWRDGDRVEIELPMRTTVERLPDGSDWVALLRGPIVLASPAGTNDLVGLRADDARMGHVAHGPTVPLDRVPVLLASANDLPKHVVADVAAGPLSFRLTDVVEPAAPKGLPLVPFFRLHDARYQMYWQTTTKEDLTVRSERLAADERAKAAREAATLDSVAVGEQQPEVEHDFKGESNSGTHEGRRWRDGRWFQYTLDTRGEKAVDLVVTYWGGDGGRTFEILADGKLLATQELRAEKPGEFLEKRYAIPAELLASARNGRVTIKFVAKVWVAGGAFDIRLMRPVTPAAGN